MDLITLSRPHQHSKFFLFFLFAPMGDILFPIAAIITEQSSDHTRYSTLCSVLCVCVLCVDQKKFIK